MMKSGKAVGRLAAFFAVVVLTFCLAATARAWTVEVYNDTRRQINIDFYTSPFIGGQLHGCNYNGGRGTITFDSGGDCPGGWRGTIWDGKNWSKIEMTSCLGHAIGSKWLMTPCCWNHKVKICRKRGNGKTIRDYDYGFCWNN